MALISGRVVSIARLTAPSITAQLPTHPFSTKRWPDSPRRDNPHPLKTAARVLLVSLLVGTGISHLTVARRNFRAQVPDWAPLSTDATVLASGVAEVALCSALVFATKAFRATVGKVAATFVVVDFPGGVSQVVHHPSAFGLDTDRTRIVRLCFQPVLVAWALKSTQGAEES